MVNPGNQKQSVNYNSSIVVDENEKYRRAHLSKVEATSVIRRLPEGVIYEIDAPGVKSKNDVVITKLEQSVEVKIYTEDKCYIKSIPLKLEILGLSVREDKVLLSIKG